MANLTYKDLFTLVLDLIKSKGDYPDIDSWEDYLERSQVLDPVSMTARGVSVDLAEITNTVMDLLKSVLPPRIRSGLTVKETDPYSNKVTVTAGEGTVGGKIFSLSKNEDIEIPFDSTTEIFYVTLYYDGLRVENIESPDKLTLAKIIVPKPGTTIWVRDNKDGWNAYIINLKEYVLHGDDRGNLEEDTIEFLRDNISPILADNIIGNIKLNEDLKIINTAGTLELNSDSMKLIDENDVVLAKFNRNGTYFYDSNGIEMARFTNIDARIGNILINKNNIGSTNYVSEESGFRIQDDGFAEFEDVRVRGVISSSVFEYDTISSVAGKLIIQNATILDENISSTDTTITVQDGVFSIGDILRIKDGTNEEYMEVIDETSGAITFTVTRHLNQTSGESAPSWKKGTAIVSTGIGTAGSQTGFILLDAISTHAPFIDINSRNSTTYDDWDTKVRLGNLAGVTDNEYGLLSGYGLYSDNVYLKGSLYSPTIKTAISGQRIELTDEGLFLYDSNGLRRFGAFLTSISGDADDGDVIIGQVGSGAYVQWDDSTATLEVRGTLNADDLDVGTISADRIGANSITSDHIASNTITANEIATSTITATEMNVTQLSAIAADLGTITAGTVTGATLQTASSGSRIVMNTTDLIGYDDSNNEVFHIELSGTDVGDVIIGNVSGADYVKWDKSAGTLTIRGTLDGGDITASTIDTTQLNASAVTTVKINNLAVDETKLAASAVSQGKAKTSIAETSVDIDASSFDYVDTPHTGTYGLLIQVKGESTDIEMEGYYYAACPQSYATAKIRFTNNNVSDWKTAYTYQRYVASSGKDYWIFLMRDKNTKRIKRGYLSPDHPCCGSPFDENERPYPFVDYYDANKHEIILVDNEILDKIKPKVTRKRTLLTIINEDYKIDVSSSPVYKEREIVELDEFDDRKGEVIEEMKVPRELKFMFTKDKIKIKKRMVKKLPNYIKYKKLKKKNMNVFIR